MGSSTLQLLIVTYLVVLIGKLVDEISFTLLRSEAGRHLDKRNNLAGDILIFDNATLPIEANNELYADVPPKTVIEVGIIIYPANLDHGRIFYKKSEAAQFWG